MCGPGENVLTLARDAVLRACGDAGLRAGDLGAETMLVHIQNGFTAFTPPAAILLSRELGFETVRATGIDGVCARADRDGVLMIGGIQYTRRCRECWHSDHYPLPPLEKKVIYLDQMVISHMTKAAGRDIDSFWRKLFEKLDVVCKMQLAICPGTATHRSEQNDPQVRAER